MYHIYNKRKAQKVLFEWATQSLLPAPLLLCAEGPITVYAGLEKVTRVGWRSTQQLKRWRKKTHVQVSRRWWFPAACGQPASIIFIKTCSALLGTLEYSELNVRLMDCAFCVAGHRQSVQPSRVFLVKCSAPDGDDLLFVICSYFFPPISSIDLFQTVGVNILF